jgi:hypothetical protein
MSVEALTQNFPTVELVTRLSILQPIGPLDDGRAYNR